MSLHARTWSVALPLAQGWVELPTASLHIGHWSSSTARQLLAADDETDEVRALADELAQWASDCRSRSPVLACAFYPDPRAVAAALVEVQAYWPDDDHPEIGLDWLTERLGAHDDGPLAEAEVATVDLPAGPAVRVHRFVEADPEAGDAAAANLLVESVTYGVRPPNLDAAVVMTASWISLSLGDELVRIADALAQRLEVGVED